jgi:prepilin-type processing-associated H-X9-DG protein
LRPVREGESLKLAYDAGKNPQMATLGPMTMIYFASVGAKFAATRQVMTARSSPRQAQSSSNLKQIALAMMNYENANRTFPPAYTTDKSGKPLLSWRVHMLPFMEGANVYEQFHLDEPWDSDHNKKLIAQMPDVYKAPGSKVAGQGKTNYLTVRGPHTVFPGKEKIGIAQITDGTSNTIMTVEVSDQKAVIWTKPDDFQYDEKDPLAGLVGLRPGGFNVGMADGSVRFIQASIDPETLKALFTRDGGERIAPPSAESRPSLPASPAMPPPVMPRR